MNRKPFFVVLAELITGYSPRNLGRHIRLSWFLPTPGNMIFTLLVVGCLLASQSVWLLSLRSPSGTSTKTIPYQGRLTDPHRIPLTGKFNMEFRLGIPRFLTDDLSTCSWNTLLLKRAT